jgi:hypothetical protein
MLASTECTYGPFKMEAVRQRDKDAINVWVIKNVYMLSAANHGCHIEDNTNLGMSP